MIVSLKLFTRRSASWSSSPSCLDAVNSHPWSTPSMSCLSSPRKMSFPHTRFIWFIYYLLPVHAHGVALQLDLCQSLPSQAPPSINTILLVLAQPHEHHLSIILFILNTTHLLRSCCCGTWTWWRSVTWQPSWASCQMCASSWTTQRKPGKQIRFLTVQVRYRSVRLFPLIASPFPYHRNRLHLSFENL